MRTPARRLTAASLALVGVFGCSHPHDRIIGSAGPSLRLVTKSSGHMDLATAAATTGADSELKRAELKRLGYSGGTVRIWRAPTGDFAAVFVFRLRSVSAGAALVQFEVDQLRKRAGGKVYSPDLTGGGLFRVDGVPGATGFVVTGQDRGEKQPLFVNGVFFVRGSRAYLVETGGTAPTGVDEVTALARRQAALVSG